MKLLLTTIIAFLLTGCNSGSGGSSAGLSSLFGSGSGGAGSSVSNLISDSGGVISAHTPEPSTMILLGVGLAGLALANRLKKNKKQ